MRDHIPQLTLMRLGFLLNHNGFSSKATNFLGCGCAGEFNSELLTYKERIQMYEDVVKSLMEVKTPAKHLSEITKIINLTEDAELKKLLTPVITALTQHSTVAPPLARKEPRNFSRGVPFDAVFHYCLPKIQAKRPEWQIIALRNGWTPPEQSV